MYKILFVIAIASIFTASCTGSQRASEPMYEASPLNYLYDKVDETSQAFGDNSPRQRLITYDATMRIEIDSYEDSITDFLKSTAAKYGGYITYSSEYSTRMQVDAKHLEAAMLDLSVLGDVTSKNITGEDVTEQFTDIEIRLENALSARKRYLELLAKAENVSAALLVEKELERLNREIDLIEGQKKLLEQNINYSSITILLNEKVKPGILGYIGIGIYEGIKWLFVRG